MRSVFIHPRLMPGIVAGLLATVSGGAWAQCETALPGPSEVVFNWNDDMLHEWGGVGSPTMNTDRQFVTEGSGSAMVDFTGQPNWAADAFVLNFAEPQDWSKYGIVSVDVFTPEESIDPASGWNELWLEAAGYSGVRGLNRGGWQTLFWSIDPERAKEVTRVVLGGNTGAPFTGPLYFDNFKGYLRKATGLAAGDRLIAGFNETSNIDLLTPTTHGDATVGVSRTTDMEFVTEGSGSLALDLTDVRAWQPDVLRPADATVANLPQPVDLTQACSVMYDVYVPAESHPAWYSIGIRLQGSGDQIFEYVGSVAPGWNTLVAPINDTIRPMLNDVDKVWFLVGSGDDDAGTWKGPIYIDAVRAVLPPTTGADPMLGDLNGDKAVDLKDATLSLQIAVATITPTDAKKATGDVNKDAKWDLKDTTLILQFAVGNITKF